MSWPPPPPPPWLPPQPMSRHPYPHQPPPPPNFSQPPFAPPYAVPMLPYPPFNNLQYNVPQHPPNVHYSYSHNPYGNPQHAPRPTQRRPPKRPHVPQPNNSGGGASSAPSGTVAERPAVKEKKKNPGAVKRDLQASKDAVRRLGRKLPGDSKEDIERWIAERKRNWPSRKNVEEKLARERESKAAGKPKQSMALGGSLSKLSEYGSSEDGEVRENIRGRGGRGRGGRGRGGKRGREGEGRGNGKKRAKRTKNKRGMQQNAVSRKPTLLRMLLDDEIKREQSILLQAFRHILLRNQEQQSLEHTNS